MSNLSNTHFNWNLIPSFLAALERGSLLAAAKELGIAQPTAGRHIAELEVQLKTALFERTGRGLRPTAAALLLAQSARAMKSASSELETLAAGRSGETLAGTVRLSASSPISTYLLPRILARMRTVLPNIQVELVVSNAVSNLLQREADIALRMVQPEQSAVIAKRLGKVALGIYAHSDYLAAWGTPQTPADLFTHDLIGFDQSSSMIEGFAQGGFAITKEQFAFRTDDFVTQWQAIRAGLGIGFVANYVAGTDATVTRILPTLKLPDIPIWLVVHREIQGNKRIRAVFDFLAAEVPVAL